MQATDLESTLATPATRRRRLAASFHADLTAGHPWLVALRPRQWTKNLLVFAGILFAAELGDPSRWVEAAAAFVAYCAASSAAYLVNDVRDAEEDRRHPIKRFRPIASGALRPSQGLAMAAVLVALAGAMTATLGPLSLALLATFVALQAAYSLSLKRVILIDVMAISGLFVIRAAAGAEAISVRISPWLLLCTGLLALFLALAKRRGELVLVSASGTSGRPVLEGYSLPLVDQLVGIVAASTVIAYSIYTVTVHSEAMMLTIPFVLFGLFRYLYLIHRQGVGEEPEQVLLSDWAIFACIAAWAAVSAVILVAL